MTQLDWLFDNPHLQQNLLSSLLFLLLILGARSLIIRRILHSRIAGSDIKKRWVANTRNFTIALLLLGWFVIWAREIQTFAISIAAVAAAFVIATKELILCILGGLLKTFNKGFRVGERIEINGIRGEVFDSNLFVTILDEIGPGKSTHQFTGKRIHLPNSLFLSHAIINESFVKKYSIHSFVIPIGVGESSLEKRDLLLECCREVCAPYLEDAKNQMRKLQKQEGLDTPSVSPRVHLHFRENDKLDLIARVPVPEGKLGAKEQEIIENFLRKQWQNKEPAQD